MTKEWIGRKAVFQAMRSFGKAEIARLAVGFGVKHDAAWRLEEPALPLVQSGLNGFVPGKEGIADMIEAVFGGDGYAHTSSNSGSAVRTAQSLSAH